MLSDEENEAIEWLKRLVKINKRDNLDNTFAEILLNLIEKQSKEIEELKENNKKLTDEYLIQRDLINPDFLKDYISKEEADQKERKAYIDGTNVAHELCNKMWKNKIKAKIEELEKELETVEQMKPSATRYDVIQKLENQINILQSLLEKE